MSGPARLRLGVGGIPAGDHHVADPVEQDRQGEDDGVGLGDQPPVGHVRHQREAEHDAEEWADVRGDLRLVGQLGYDIERHDEQCRKDEKAQLGAPFWFGADHVARQYCVTIA